MTVAELTYGRGTPMSAHELTVVWPAFFRYQERERERQQEKDELEAQRARRRRR